MATVSKIAELFGHAASPANNANWREVATAQFCPYLQRKCLGLQADANVAFDEIAKQIEAKMSDDTLFAPA